ncbi:MAG: Asp-tRNA(Asn)/Glu-tRNA(Gln) amidotransferase subunit GatC [Bacteroidia bacterium]|nr:Asp-tRNA(Asn)/Glu-tRNA(Gln) amidotransferase subunit GatC [Bacteroidia bacterium]MDW8089120.1 Asp-tRNA(Asn)/Glu-tRNA(Gln) amidotransferase subunit GatC [Bacteroidia bacterium]
MNITESLLDDLCELARLHLEGEERAALRKDLERIVSFVEKINELPLEEVEPMRFVGEPAEVLRSDIPEPPVDTTLLFANAPRTDGLYLRVPKFHAKGS